MAKTTMRDEVEATITALELPDQHKAAGALARVYADQLDSAIAAEAHADFVLAAARKRGADKDIEELIQALSGKLSARTTVATIGPRLSELLGRLLATPKDARGAAAAVEPVRQAATPGSLALLRGGRGG